MGANQPSHTHLAVAELLEVPTSAGLLGPVHEDLLIGHHNGHTAGLEAVPIQKRLRHKATTQVDVLHLFRGNVLALEGRGGERGSAYLYPYTLPLLHLR